MENQCSLSVEDYLKAFLESEVKPLWPKGWMQSRSVCAFYFLNGSCLLLVQMQTTQFCPLFTDVPHFPCFISQVSDDVLVVFNPEKLTRVFLIVVSLRILFKESLTVHSHLTGNL